MQAEIDALSKCLGVTLTAKRIWAASNGEGFAATSVKFKPVPDDPYGKSVLVIVFRSTKGLPEWLEYPLQCFTVPRDGSTQDGTLRVLKVWKRTLDKLNKGGHVWLTGHRKGGAVATTAASRLVLGDSAQDNTLPARVRRPAEPSLSSALKRLSVFTFNAPKALNRPLAEEYEKKIREMGMKINEMGMAHIRYETEGDVVVDLPPPWLLWLQLEHVGKRVSSARDVGNATDNTEVRRVKIVAGLVLFGGTLAVWAMCWTGLVVGGRMFALWCVWRGVVIAMVFGVTKLAEVREETQPRHVMSPPICNPYDESQPLQSTCIVLRQYLSEFRKRLGLLKTDDANRSKVSPEVEERFLERTISENSLPEEYLNRTEEVYLLCVSVSGRLSSRAICA